MTLIDYLVFINDGIYDDNIYIEFNGDIWRNDLKF